jgi:glycerol kinase
VAEPDLVLVLDQGTTSSRALIYDRDGAARAEARRDLRQFYPRRGWVEHDPEDIWRDSVQVMREALARAGVDAGALASIGIANQRETTVIWERDGGRAIHNAIVWQDRRTADACARLAADGAEARIAALTGLVIDPYFSATKAAWLLDHVAGARAQAERGRLALGTVDSFLLWRLTGGRVHATDATNAARTQLFDIHRRAWSDELRALFGVPRALLPEVGDSAGDFGVTDSDVLGAPVPIRGVAGDQQAAMIGQACLVPGMIKSTYGTGCFALINSGVEPVASRARLLTTIAYQLAGKASYALEGSIFAAGAAVQWLRDGLGVLADVADSAALAARADPDGGVVMVPAFTGLGAPYWDAHARGAVLGLTRDTDAADLVRAALDSVAFQTRDLIGAMEADSAAVPTALRVDGGMARNDWFLQRLADLLGLPVEKPVEVETTAFGAACLAGLGAGVIDGFGALAERWRLDRRFEPALDAGRRDRLYARWHDAVARVREGGGSQV